MKKFLENMNTGSKSSSIIKFSDFKSIPTSNKTKKKKSKGHTRG
jgi:hypothetical protein